LVIGTGQGDVAGEHHRMAGTVQGALALGVIEAVTNVVVHAYGDRADRGEVDVEARAVDAHPRVYVSS
jgi:anti-sigma regulatory factor (Ser/Thr protein kinase)